MSKIGDSIKTAADSAKSTTSDGIDKNPLAIVLGG
jgi:hypothetical protein